MVQKQSYQNTIVKHSQSIQLVGAYGFLCMLPCSIAFSQMFLGLFVFGLLVDIALSRHFQFPKTLLNTPLAVYIVVVLLTTMFSLDVARSIKGLDALLSIAVFYVFYLYIHDLAQLKKSTRLLITVITIAAGYGVLQHYLYVNPFRLSQPISFLSHVNDDLTAPVRITGFFSSYMTFSGQLAMMFPVVVAGVFMAKNWVNRMWLIMAALLVAVALFWTYTRSAWIAAISALLLFLWMRGKKLWVGVVVLLLLIGVMLLQFNLLGKNSNIFRNKDRERIYTWITTLDMIKDHPLTGIGKRNYSSQIQPYRERRYPRFEFSSDAHAHNNILQVTADSGIPAGLCFIWLWGVAFWNMHRTYYHISAQDTAVRWMVLGFFGAVIAFFVQGFFEHNFGDSESVMMMWLCMAFGLKLRDLVSRSKQ